MRGAYNIIDTKGTLEWHRNLLRHMWKGPYDPNMGESPMRLEHSPPMEIRSHEGKAMNIGYLMTSEF
jgi:hypothetical protein